MHYRRLGLGLLMGAGAGTVLSSCSSGSNAGPPPITDAGRGGSSSGNAGRGGSSGRAGASNTGGDAGDPGAGGGDSGGNPGTGGSSQAGTGGTGGLPPGAGVGEDCTDGTRCRSGLECLDGECTPSGSTGPGEPCLIQPECQAALQCIAGSCVPDGDGQAGDSCLLDDDCAAGLKCVITGLTSACLPQGDGDVGADCTNTTDCFAGLACLDGECTPQLPGIPVWPGVECEPATEGSVRAFFEVPGAEDAVEGDFFRLPFPNDALRGDGGLNLAGFPTPGTGLLGADPVELYADALESDAGWGTYGTVFFRFSGVIDVFDDNGDTRLDVSWVDITPDAPERGSSVGLYWYYSGGRNNYVCDNWVGVRRPRGYPMLPGHTYAVWMTTSVVAEDGSMVRRSPNLVSVLADEAPDDPVLVPVHEAYAPFREFLDSEGVSPATVLNATVFTVAGTRDIMRDLAAAVEDLPAPSVQGDWVKCEDGVDSPCPDHEGSRNCGASSADYDEYHALVRLPIFQEGTPPYETPADGGGIEIADDPPTEDVCLALTVPTGTMPAAGWPLAVFAHGTGGSFRSHVDASIAGALSSGDVKFAVLGIDQVSHGPRRGDSTTEPDQLFFNFLNPAAARGNPLQGATDQLSLAKFAATIDGSGDMPTTIDPAQLVFFGHSQGSTEGSLMLPYADAYKAAVLSGNGASLMNALLTKTEPVDIAGLMPIALSDLRGLMGDIAEFHPVVSLLQQWIDPADPLNFASGVAVAPPEGHTGKHVFQTYGTNDHYSPPVTMAIYAAAGGLTLVEPIEDDFEDAFAIGIASQAAPLSGNTGAGMLTAGVRQYEEGDDSDGHFVVYDVPEANADVVRFLSQAVSGTIPQIGE
ncbi:MAG TPA: hypothetical protein VGK73_23585 [Polyangiaceae bacterium]